MQNAGLRLSRMYAHDNKRHMLHDKTEAGVPLDIRWMTVLGSRPASSLQLQPWHCLPVKQAADAAQTSANVPRILQCTAPESVYAQLRSVSPPLRCLGWTTTVVLQRFSKGCCSRQPNNPFATMA